MKKTATKKTTPSSQTLNADSLLHSLHILRDAPLKATAKQMKSLHPNSSVMAELFTTQNKATHLCFDTAPLAIANAYTPARWKLAEVIGEMNRLSREGMVNATIWMKEGKYAHYSYPSENGKRKRPYIGSDPEAIAAARQKIANFHAYKALENDLRHITRAFQRAQYQINEALGDLKGIAELTPSKPESPAVRLPRRNTMIAQDDEYEFDE